MRRVVLGTLLLSVFCATSVGATTLRELSLVDLNEGSNLVVLGEVVQVDSYWSGGVIFTEITLSVVDCFKGSCAEEIAVTTVGGQVGDIAQRVQGAAYFNPGERVFAFLRSSEAHGLVTVGMAQGLFHLEQVDDDVLAWADHSGMQLVDRHGEVHDGAQRVTYHLADLIYAVRYNSPVLPMSPHDWAGLASN